MVQVLRYRRGLLVIVAAALIGCAPRVDKPAPEASEASQAAAEAAASAVDAPAPAVPERRPAPTRRAAPARVAPTGDFEVDPAASDVRIFVYRSGRLARVGHNHVISSRDVQGKVSVSRTKNLKGSTVKLRIPVATLVVDDPALRKEAGEEFESALTQEQIDGTLRTMLSAAVLHAAPFPLVTVKGTVVGGTLPDLELDAVMTVRDREHQFRTPVRVERTEDSVTASGEFRIRQSDFEIEPVNLLQGALSVNDEFKVQFRIVARR